jgi:hypothetical protein
MADLDDTAWNALLSGASSEANHTDEESSKRQDDEPDEDQGGRGE